MQVCKCIEIRQGDGMLGRELRWLSMRWLLLAQGATHLPVAKVRVSITVVPHQC
jgi:hypothetical protein